MLLCFDFVLTFPDEVDLIWRRKFRVGSLLFMMNRVAAVLTAFVMMSESFAEVCSSQLTDWTLTDMFFQPGL